MTANCALITGENIQFVSIQMEIWAGGLGRQNRFCMTQTQNLWLDLIALK